MPTSTASTADTSSGLKSAIAASRIRVAALERELDAEAMKEKATALAQVAMKLGEAIYKEEQAAGASAEAASEEAPADDNVVDAEFSEVEDDKKD